MYETGAWPTFPPSAWDAHPLASPLEIAAPHILRCRRNVNQCSVPTNIILYLYSPFLWAMNVHRSRWMALLLKKVYWGPVFFRFLWTSRLLPLHLPFYYIRPIIPLALGPLRKYKDITKNTNKYTTWTPPPHFRPAKQNIYIYINLPAKMQIQKLHISITERSRLYIEEFSNRAWSVWRQIL